MHSFTITSTLCDAILPRTDDGLSEVEIGLPKDDVGLSVQTAADIEIDISWQYKDDGKLRRLSTIN